MRVAESVVLVIFKNVALTFESAQNHVRTIQMQFLQLLFAWLAYFSVIY